MRPRLQILVLVPFLAALASAQEKAPADPKVRRPPEVARIAELRLRLDATEDPQSPLWFARRKFRLRTFVAAVRQAARDPDIHGAILRPDHYEIGWARLFEIRAALEELRRAGKPLFCYAESLAAADLVLASAADRVSVPESGMVFVPGFAVEMLYLRELLAKLHIRFEVIHIGEYKTAGESLVRDSMSAELKESLDPVLDEYFDSLVGTIARGRRIPTEQVRRAVDRGLLSAREAKAAGLVDRVEYEDQFRRGLEAFFPQKRLEIRRDYPHEKREEIDFSNPLKLVTQLARMMGGAKRPLPKGPKIAVVYCTGMIVSGESQYGWDGGVVAMGSKTVVKAIDRAAGNADVKAIVLRINSPGGSGLASDMIWRAVERAKQRKPVIASMGDLAASGGYYIAMNSHRIVAEPQTITGSIGVVGILP
ncbi:MAG: S49 family peptidase, partial [Planctomycetota bacterium]